MSQRQPVVYTRELVLSKVRKVFSSYDPAEIMAFLDLYGTESYERERERVQLAILKLSKGARDAMLKYIGVAKRDYRDVLAWAEYPGAMGVGSGDKDGLEAPDRQDIGKRDLQQYLNWLNDMDLSDMTE